MAPLAVSNTLSPAQSTTAPDGVTAVAGDGSMVIVILLLVACRGEAQAAVEVTTTCTLPPFAIDDVVKLSLLVPALDPLIDH